MKGLIIRKRWLDMILAGAKTWEMRSRPTRYRGPIALICQGSGGQILGSAELIDCLPPLSEAEFEAARCCHGIPPEDDADVLRDGWVVPWALCKVRKLDKPVPSGQRAGAVTWVTLEPSVIAQLRGWPAQEAA